MILNAYVLLQHTNNKYKVFFLHDSYLFNNRFVNDENNKFWKDNISPMITISRAFKGKP